MAAPFTTKEQVDRCWDSMSLRQKQIIRQHMEGYDLTMWQVMNRWPALRVERKATS